MIKLLIFALSTLACAHAAPSRTVEKNALATLALAQPEIDTAREDAYRADLRAAPLEGLVAAALVEAKRLAATKAFYRSLRMARASVDTATSAELKVILDEVLAAGADLAALVTLPAQAQRALATLRARAP